ncbi:ankyrin repeat domain-containing protein [Candidatus Similichlamydia epinepheli]|uniref:ankyrin repeat domain-containing protein n=1 Tax=Candidatus Similichlamydia epinepheli TaxID=1903953 RepID=UPI003B967E99
MGGDTPLHISVRAGDGDMCKFLLSKGADQKNDNTTEKSVTPKNPTNPTESNDPKVVKSVRVYLP